MKMKDDRKVYEVFIEKNVPVPSKYWSKWAKIVDDMEINDSIVLPNRTTADRFCQHGNRRGMKFTVRQQDKGLRIWRIK